jgi:hypothetical protein
MTDLELLTIGMVMDMFYESDLDKDEPVYKATEDDMKNF